MVLRLTSQHSGVKVDAQLSCLSHIIHVQFPHRLIALFDVRLQKNITVKCAVFLIRLLHICTETIMKYILRRET